VLRALDRCLGTLEEANERGEARLSYELATRLRQYVPALQPGTPLTEAMDNVFRLQEAWLDAVQARDETREPRAGRNGGNPIHTRPRTDEVPQAVHDTPGSDQAWITEADARALTETIRSGLKEVALLLLEAHERRAWAVLGYHSWEAYARQEFGMSRSRSYEILDQGRVILQLQAAAGLGTPPIVSPYAASQIKPHLSEVLNEIQNRTHACASSQQAETIIFEVIANVRKQLQSRRYPVQGSESKNEATPGTCLVIPRRGSVRKLRLAIDYLANLPPVAEYLCLIDADLPLNSVQLASNWLADLAEALAVRGSGASSLVVAKGA